MAQTVRYHTWESQSANQDTTDKIVVRNLQATANAGVDAWGRKKEQPALVTVTVSLRQSFSSAAAADSLDNSTIDYGILSKKIRSAINSILPHGHLQTDALAMLIDDEVRQVAGNTPLASTEVDIFYPKASRYGDGAGFRYSISYLHAPFSVVLYLQNLRVDCIIGINPNEELQKQPVVVNLWVDAVRSGRADDYTKIESVVVEAISNSSMGTLESLTTMVVQELNQKFFTKDDEGSYIRLRIEKPLAVPFADGPAIEIVRPVKGVAPS